MLEILRERGVEFDVIEYLNSPLDRAALEGLLDRIPDPAQGLVRRDHLFKELGIGADRTETREAVLDLLLEHPALMQRPVVVRGPRALIARPADKVLELLT
ncbi:MAG: ArsC/Spx/MgsR family protein [Myxococcota bacterium]